MSRTSSSPRGASPATPLSQWLRDAARQHPNACALEAPDAQLSYSELLNAVDALVAKLKSSGFAKGDRLGIAATRSSQAIVAILSAIDAGLGYVPLDLSYPADRLEAMLQDAQPRAVLGDAAALASLRDLVGDFPTLEKPAARGERLHASNDDLAYVLFTSGSTGRPKGVAMPVTPLAHLIQFHAEHPRLGKTARTLQFAPLSFDVHFQEIFSTLACAGTLVLLAEPVRRDPAQLQAALISLGIERVFMPYVALQMIAEASRESVPHTLLDVVSAGEQLQITPAIRSLFARLPNAALHNHYGPTETHVVAEHQIPGTADQWPEIPPIGQALPHVQLALRDPQTQTVTTEDTGELLLGGDTLADGYLGRAELTAERFLESVDGLSGRWYATGDLVKRAANGDYTYLGRADQQLKVDGFRIEPGEIELALMAHNAVKDAVVTAPDLPGIGKQLVAHIVLREGVDASGLRAHLRGRLPEYMVPVRFVELERLPITPSGKIDRRSLPLPQVESPTPAGADPAQVIRSLWQELLGTADIGADQNLFDLGARSLLVLRFVTRLKDLGITGITVADVYDRPTLAGITAAATGQKSSVRKSTASRPQGVQGIAIIGMASRTPGAANVETFWQNLLDGREGIRHFTADELDASVPESIRNRPNFVAARGVLEDADRFDAAFFGISAREATMLDPQQRLLLELCWNALEDAAIDPTRTEARIGVYAGSANNTYTPALRQAQPELVQQYGEFATMLASEKDYVATRVAHRLNLNGPAVSIHTACSTGLVAVAQAWHALASGQCDVALAGGAALMVPQAGGYLHVEGAMESADGHCRPFDAEATGTVFANGAAAVVLKRLDDALADGDTIHAVIRGVGLNNDGGDKASFTAPSVSGQAGAIRMALDHAQVSARSIGYVEAHGTGTALGDPIELAALTRAWRDDTEDKQFCGIGSVKSNLGHMVAAAGVVGLIKAVMSLKREVIPRTLHFRQPNPQIDFASTPFHVLADNTPWPRNQQVRRAAVSSFGVGGTNAHVILEEAPVPSRQGNALDGRLLVLPLSARTSTAALQRARDLADHLEQHPQLALADVAATLMRGRRPLAQRLSVVAASVADAVTALRGVKSSTAALAKPRVVFLFPGQGSQHPGMASRLYDEAPAFHDALDRCLAIATPSLGVDLRSWLVDADPADATVSQLLAETRHAQPALFAMSYALAAWLESLNVRPDAMIGHSIGEYAAACHAGVFSLADALKAVIARGRAMFDQERGAMLAVRTGAQALQSLLPAGVEIAGCNAPALTVVSGSHEAITRFAAQLEAQDIGTTALRVSHAFHSASMEGALPRIEQALREASLHAPRIKLYSCISGAPLTASEATDPHYWARQVRAPVQFSTAVSAELAQADTVFVEVGPGQALTALLRQHRTAQNAVPRNVALLGPANNAGDPAMQALQALGTLWSHGVDLAWPVAATAQRVPLPIYPFEGDRHWFKPSAATAPAIDPIHPSTAASPALANPPTEVRVIMSRIPNIERELQRILSDVSGVAVEDMARDNSFVDQGLDSLSLTQATLELERVFGMKLRFRRLLEDLDNVEKLARFLDAEMPADKFAPAPVVAPTAAPVVQAAQPSPPAPSISPSWQVAMPEAVAGGSALHQLIQQQMQLMSQQLALLSGAPQAPALTAPAVLAPVASAAARIAPAAATTQATVEPQTAATTSLIEKPFGASPRLTLKAKQEFTPKQRAWLDDFIARCNARFATSKSFSQKHRKVMADPRVATGFNPLWKDLVYPIVVNRSKGARMWDVDGNQFIDLLSAFGANLLGYQPDDVRDAMIEQINAGIEVGPQHPLAAEVADLISEFTGMERVAFCNTGSEAVMGAMRIARTVTGRKTIAIFTNSYHGIFDEVIVRGTKQLRSLSAAPGILANAVENVLVLDYCSEDSLRVLKERGHELAAVMIEPIQNKYPTLQPREFVKSLRSICDEAGCALIFDEVVTGFRVAPGGAQELLGVRADIATFGKVIGGGLPFAAIGGSSHWLDALDGGHWQYGDDSYPEAGVTYFAGTFVRHPLALAAARASLLHLKRGGREIYRTLNERTQALITRLNTAFAARGAPVKAVHCASLWRLSWDDGQKYVSLFYWLVRYHGLHLYEQFGHFVTEAMGDAETDRIFQVFTQAIDELMALGLITPREGGPAPRDPGDGSSKGLSEGPLTPGQTERWLAGAFDPSARRALNESLCVVLQGPVDQVALKSALQDVLTRHEAFRVYFDLDQPLQRLAPVGPVPVAQVDLRNQTDADAALDAFCTEASRRDFPVDQAPLAAVSLLQLAGNRTVVHVVASHLIFDGWASSVFNAELATAYRARSTGLAPHWPVAESPLRFGTEEQARFEGEAGQESLAFWTDVLRNPPAPLSLGDLTPPSPRRYAADTARVNFDGALLTQLRTQARQAGATLFQLLLSAVTIMLQRRTGQAEFVVSIPYAAQSLQRHGPLVGDGVLDLPLRLGCNAGDSAIAVLKQVRTRLMDALEYPLMTQGTVARALGIRSAGDRPPLTGIYFNLNPKVDLSAYAPLAASMHEGRKAGTLSELFFNFYEKDDALTLDLHYSTDHLSAGRAQDIINDLFTQCAALAQSLATPVGPQATLPVVTPTKPSAAAIDPRLLTWNATDVPLEPHARIEQWVSRQAARTPDEVAIVATGTSLTYRELEARANRFGNLLRSRGVGAGMLIGVGLSRGPDLIPALLGVLKTGAAYVPLDPGFPRDRLHYMAEDADVRFVITEAANADLSGVARDKQIRIDDDAATIVAASDAPVAASPDWADDAPAYVIYTSGSTGKPKGVVLPQRAVCNFLASVKREPGMKPGDRLLAVTTLSFDIAVLELFLPLTIGARVVIAQRDDAMDGEVLGRMIHDQGITVMQATPTTWHMLLDANWRAPTGLKALCGGEALPPSLAQRMLESGVELWNMYGPTETTVWSTLSLITDARAPIVIGKPMDNTSVWILSDDLKPAPVGAEGEICIGGAGVANGYFKRPELTADRFVANPFDSTPGARLYRTGDLGRWREDGRLEHLGRLDFQVKIRGYRIELGEIEAGLAALPGVARSVVIPREDMPGDVRLIAYVVPQAAVQLDPSQMRDALRGTLPDYMLPHNVVVLEAMPLLPNGKIDRKSLPAPAGPALTSKPKGEPPRNDLERSVANAMQAVLKVADIGVSDDFFSLGGHSLLAARLIGQINRELGMHLSLRTLFESPTVEKLALAIEKARGGDAGPTRPPIVRREKQDSAPLSLMQDRINFIERMHPGRVAYHAPAGHRLRGPMNVEVFNRAFAEMVRRQAAFRTSIVPSGDGYIQQIAESVSLSLLPLTDLSSLPESEREQAMLEDMKGLVATPFALDSAPLFSARLYRLGEEHHALFFMAHHIVWDGWSFDVMYNEMAAHYAAFLEDKPSPLPELSVSYGDFAQWHNTWMESDEIRQQTEYWKQRFAVSPSQKSPHADRPRKPLSTGVGATEFITVSPEHSEQVRQLARQTGSTVSIVMLAVYTALMSQWMGDPSPAIGLPVRGRPAPELEGVMGFFNNLLPMRLPVNTSLTCVDWIKAVRHQVTEAIANQDVPFERVAQELALRSGTLYQALFNFQDLRDRPTRWGPLAHERINIMQEGATENLNMWVVESATQISGGLQYDADLFMPSSIMALRDRLISMLGQMLANPQMPLAQLLQITPSEAATLNAWEQPATLANQTDAYDALMARIAAQPDSCAIREGATIVNMRELGERVQRTAAALQVHLTAAKQTVLVSTTDPVAQWVVGLAALQCNAACIPLEAGASSSRVAAALQSNDVALVVCDAWLELTLPAGVRRLDVSVVPGARTLPRIASAEAVIGGAASPRAVDRATMAGLCNGLQALLPLRPHESVLCIDGPARAWQWTQALMAWGAGGEVILAKPELARQGAGIIALLRGERIRALHGSANMWLRILTELKGAVLPPLTAMVDVTESSPELVESLLKAGIKLVSMYRPVDSGLPLAAGAVEGVEDATVFGRPLRAGSVKVAGPQGEQLPIGVAGELLSASPVDGKTAFSTGSQVRWRSDGVLQYLGEVAGTAYVEGHRVDLRAAEARLDQHPQVARALVVARSVSGGPTQLAAYIVPKEGGPTALAMAAQLRGCVPEELLPLQCVELPTIPTLPNGEVNLNALPLVSASHPSQNQPSTSKGIETEAERVVSDIWRTVLKVDTVGLDDNFFDLGGHSLLAMSVAAEVKSRLGVELNLRQLIFESLGQIAASLEEAMTKPPVVPVVVPKRQGWLQKVVARLQA